MSMGAPVVVGAAIGATVGVALDSLGMWTTVGVAVGVAIGTALSARKKR